MNLGSIKDISEDGVRHALHYSYERLIKKVKRKHMRQFDREFWRPTACSAAMSVLVSGGGMATGQVIGSTTDKGEWPKDRKLDPNDLLATVYRHLGIDYRHEIFDDRAGRPLPLLPYGEPIAELS